MNLPHIDLENLNLLAPSNLKSSSQKNIMPAIFSTPLQKIIAEYLLPRDVRKFTSIPSFAAFISEFPMIFYVHRQATDLIQSYKDRDLNTLLSILSQYVGSPSGIRTLMKSLIYDWTDLYPEVWNDYPEAWNDPYSYNYNERYKSIPSIHHYQILVALLTRRRLKKYITRRKIVSIITDALGLVNKYVNKVINATKYKSSLRVYRSCDCSSNSDSSSDSETDEEKVIDENNNSEKKNDNSEKKNDNSEKKNNHGTIEGEIKDENIAKADDGEIKQEMIEVDGELKEEIDHELKEEIDFETKEKSNHEIKEMKNIKIIDPPSPNNINSKLILANSGYDKKKERKTDSKYIHIPTVYNNLLNLFNLLNLSLTLDYPDDAVIVRASNFLSIISKFEKFKNYIEDLSELFNSDAYKRSRKEDFSCDSKYSSSDSECSCCDSEYSSPVGDKDNNKNVSDDGDAGDNKNVNSDGDAGDNKNVNSDGDGDGENKDTINGDGNGENKNIINDGENKFINKEEKNAKNDENKSTNNDKLEANMKLGKLKKNKNKKRIEKEKLNDINYEAKLINSMREIQDKIMAQIFIATSVSPIQYQLYLHRNKHIKIAKPRSPKSPKSPIGDNKDSDDDNKDFKDNDDDKDFKDNNDSKNFKNDDIKIFKWDKDIEDFKENKESKKNAVIPTLWQKLESENKISSAVQKLILVDQLNFRDKKVKIRGSWEYTKYNNLTSSNECKSNNESKPSNTKFIISQILGDKNFLDETGKDEDFFFITLLTLLRIFSASKKSNILLFVAEMTTRIIFHFNDRNNITLDNIDFAYECIKDIKFNLGKSKIAKRIEYNLEVINKSAAFIKLAVNKKSSANIEINRIKFLNRDGFSNDSGRENDGDRENDGSSDSDSSSCTSDSEYSCCNSYSDDE